MTISWGKAVPIPDKPLFGATMGQAEPERTMCATDPLAECPWRR